MDPVCLVCLHELLHSNHNSPFLFCHVYYTVSVTIFAGPKGLDSVLVQTPAIMPDNTLWHHAGRWADARSRQPSAGQTCARTRAETRGQKGRVCLPHRAQLAAAQAGGVDPPRPWEPGAHPLLYFALKSGNRHQPACGSARDGSLQKPTGCVGWCLLQEPGQARLAGAGAQGFWR